MSKKREITKLLVKKDILVEEDSHAPYKYSIGALVEDAIGILREFDNNSVNIFNPENNKLKEWLVKYDEIQSKYKKNKFKRLVNIGKIAGFAEYEIVAAQILRILNEEYGYSFSYKSDSLEGQVRELSENYITKANQQVIISPKSYNVCPLAVCKSHKYKDAYLYQLISPEKLKRPELVLAIAHLQVGIAVPEFDYLPKKTDALVRKLFESEEALKPAYSKIADTLKNIFKR